LCLCGSCVLSQTSDATLLRRYFQEGEKALAEQRYADAEKAYEKLRQLDPGSAEVHAKLGVIYFQQGKFSQAVPVFRQALKLKPGLPNVDILLAMCQSELGHYREALPGLQKGFERSSDAALKRMAGLQLQRAYTGLEEDRKAVEVALELNRLYPEDPEVLYHAGKLFGNFAYLAMRKLAGVAPQSVWRRLAAAEAYESQGDYDLAIITYREVLKLTPARPGTHFRLGRTLLARSRQATAQVEDVAEAMKEFEQELALDPTNANAAYELAEAHRKAGDLQKAQKYFEVALVHYPDFQEAQVGLGRVLLALGKPDLALPHLEKAIALNPADEIPYYHLAQVHRVRGNDAEQQKALAEFRRRRSQRLSEQETLADLFEHREVTKQELDPEVKP
jgi:tetratricopeptide (TPR) repeat protein